MTIPTRKSKKTVCCKVCPVGVDTVGRPSEGLPFVSLSLERFYDTLVENKRRVEEKRDETESSAGMGESGTGR